LAENKRIVLTVLNGAYPLPGKYCTVYYCTAVIRTPNWTVPVKT
jgi:hypothetical protein